MFVTIFVVFVFVTLVGRVYAQTQTSLPKAFYGGVSSDFSGTYLTAVAINGPIYYSNDSGVSWKLSDAPIRGSYFDVAASSTGNYVIAAAFSAILLSADYGQHFTNAVNLTNTDKVAISGSGQFMLSVYSSERWHLAYSNNYGASFMLGLGPNSNGSSCTNVAIDTSGTYVVISVLNEGLWTTNNITDPLAWKLTYETKAKIYEIAFGGTSFYAGYLSSPGYVVQSTNYGYNWTVKGSVSDPITSIAVDSTGVNVLVTTYFGLYLSQDSGSSFDWIYSAELYECAMNGNTTFAVFAGAATGSNTYYYNVIVGNPCKNTTIYTSFPSYCSFLFSLVEMAAGPADNDSDDDAISPGIIAAIAIGSFAFCCVVACVFIRLYFGRLLICWPANESLKETFLSKA